MFSLYSSLFYAVKSLVRTSGRGCSVATLEITIVSPCINMNKCWVFANTSSKNEVLFCDGILEGLSAQSLGGGMDLRGSLAPRLNISRLKLLVETAGSPSNSLVVGIAAVGGGDDNRNSKRSP